MARIPSEPVALKQAITDLEAMLARLVEYVDSVVSGAVEGNEELGVAVTEAISEVVAMAPADAQDIFQSKSKDLLMVTHLTSLVRTQLSVAEKVLFLV
jgi:translation initiation factor 3 subunit F